MNKSIFLRFLHEEEGQDVVEYALLLAFVGLAAVAILSNVGKNISGLWSTVNTQISSASSAAS